MNIRVYSVEKFGIRCEIPSQGTMNAFLDRYLDSVMGYAMYLYIYIHFFIWCTNIFCFCRPLLYDILSRCCRLNQLLLILFLICHNKNMYMYIFRDVLCIHISLSCIPVNIFFFLFKDELLFTIFLRYGIYD